MITVNCVITTVTTIYDNNNGCAKCDVAMLDTMINVTLPTGFCQIIRDLLKNTWPLRNGQFDPTDFSQAELDHVYAELFSQLTQHPRLNDLTYWPRLRQAFLYHCLTDQDNTCLQKVLLDNDSLMTVLNDLVFSQMPLIDKINFCYQLYDCHTYLVTIELSTSTSCYYQQHWPVSIEPTAIVLDNGSSRLLMPLQVEQLSYTVMAYSDDNGANWLVANTPIISRWGMQPTFIQTQSNKIVAYLRNHATLLNLHSALSSESDDNGITWTPAAPILAIPNVGGQVAALKLQNHHQADWLLAYIPDSQHTLLRGAFITSEGLIRENKTLMYTLDQNEAITRFSLQQTDEDTMQVVIESNNNNTVITQISDIRGQACYDWNACCYPDW